MARRTRTVWRLPARPRPVLTEEDQQRLNIRRKADLTEAELDALQAKLEQWIATPRSPWGSWPTWEEE